MNIEELQKLKLAELKALAAEKEIKVTGLKKDEIIFKLLESEKKEEPKSEKRIIGHWARPGGS